MAPRENRTPLSLVLFSPFIFSLLSSPALANRGGFQNRPAQPRSLSFRRAGFSSRETLFVNTINHALPRSDAPRADLVVLPGRLIDLVSIITSGERSDASINTAADHGLDNATGLHHVGLQETKAGPQKKSRTECPIQPFEGCPSRLPYEDGEEAGGTSVEHLVAGIRAA